MAAGNHVLAGYYEDSRNALIADQGLSPALQTSDYNGGWNWGAFFFGAYWLIYRKMYLGGFLLLALDLFQTFMTTFVLNELKITDVQMLYNSLYEIMYSPATADRKQLLLLLSIKIYFISILLF